MKIGKDTIEVLKNFSSINPNLVIKPGNKVSTIAEAKNVMAVADLSGTMFVSLSIKSIGSLWGSRLLIFSLSISFSFIFLSFSKNLLREQRDNPLQFRYLQYL